MTDVGRFQQEGRIWLRSALNRADIEDMGALMDSPTKPGQRLVLNDARNGSLAAVTRAVNAHWPTHRPVRLVSFDKSSSTNWAVPWHQDRIIAVSTRTDVEGYSNWSQKNGVWHCEPPQQILKDMLFVRVHLDAATEDNGAMEIAVGSHTKGAIHSGEADAIAGRHKHETTVAQPGDILVLSMLTLHRSRPSQSKDRRRTLRIDYATATLPHPLAWAT